MVPPGWTAISHRSGEGKARLLILAIFSPMPPGPASMALVARTTWSTAANTSCRSKSAAGVPKVRRCVGSEVSTTLKGLDVVRQLHRAEPLGVRGDDHGATRWSRPMNAFRP